MCTHNVVCYISSVVLVYAHVTMSVGVVW